MQSSVDQRRGRSIALPLIAVIIAALAAIVTFRGIHQSSLDGRLATVPQYDDVSYFLAATKWWLAVPSRSVGGSLYAMVADHAPFATAMAALGFLLMPEGFTGPYAVNLLVLAVFLAGCARLIWPLPLPAIAACLVALASVPLLTQVVTEARPDLAWGLAMGLCSSPRCTGLSSCGRRGACSCSDCSPAAPPPSSPRRCRHRSPTSSPRSGSARCAMSWTKDTD